MLEILWWDGPVQAAETVLRESVFHSVTLATLASFNISKAYITLGNYFSAALQCDTSSKLDGHRKRCRKPSESRFGCPGRLYRRLSPPTLNCITDSLGLQNIGRGRLDDWTIYRWDGRHPRYDEIERFIDGACFLPLLAGRAEREPKNGMLAHDAEFAETILNNLRIAFDIYSTVSSRLTLRKSWVSSVDILRDTRSEVQGDCPELPIQQVSAPGHSSRAQSVHRNVEPLPRGEGHHGRTPPVDDKSEALAPPTKDAQCPELKALLRRRLGRGVTIPELTSLVKETIKAAKDFIMVDWILYGNHFLIVGYNASNAKLCTRDWIRELVVLELERWVEKHLRSVPLGQGHPRQSLSGDILTFSPSLCLNRIPLHAIPYANEDDQPFFHYHPIVYSPRSAILKGCRSKALAMDTTSQLQAKLFDCYIDNGESGIGTMENSADILRKRGASTTVTSGKDVTPTALKEMLPEADTLHFHGH
ncbi:hypothetical protein DL765_004656 [Monosporascus sp. GIB2]|nr:hypothetical protein DL765_004656 [Monosporascus sp. GIB2]